MKFGVFILGDKPNHLSEREVLANVLEEARWAEELGYDEIWLAEHHFSPYGMLPDLPQVATAIAAQTERIRIGTACMVAPFHEPIQLAERIAMVDVLSGGRFDAGFGRGYQAHEFKGFGISMDEATGRYQECVEIVSRLLTEENVSFHGKYFQIEDVTIYPRPVQQPIPVWGTVMKTPSSFEWLAEKGFGAIIGNPYQVDPDLQGALDIYLKVQSERDSTPPPATCGRCSTPFATRMTRSPVAIRAKVLSCPFKPIASIRAHSSGAGRFRPTIRLTRTGLRSTTSKATSRC